ncbi:MAG: hypothetical protein CMO81_11025 [Waddliaceae bacterium]|nr:hypothetical protein [Waddliaceae bacterium]
MYAGLLGLAAVFLAVQVILQRRKKKVALGYGKSRELKDRGRAFENFTEYVPIALLLMMIVEFSGGNQALLHMSGLSLIFGRLLHAIAIYRRIIRLRVVGMSLTFFSIVTLSLMSLYLSFGTH